VLTPDGVRYLWAAEHDIARPFHYRWLLPALCGTNVRTWTYVTRGALAASLPLIYVYVGGGWRGVAAASMVIGLSGVWKFNWAHPVLVDAAGMACALAAAILTQHGAGWWPIAIWVAAVGGCVRETTPVFAALYAWNPILLIGLAAPAVRHFQKAGEDCLDEDNLWILKHPMAASRKFHRNIPLQTYIMPWGGALAALANLDPQLAATTIVAYAQCAVATDTVRLYMWAWPVVLLAAVNAVPLAWLPVLVAVTVGNPFSGQGA
jgi:hypothetical protein